MVMGLPGIPGAKGKGWGAGGGLEISTPPPPATPPTGKAQDRWGNQYDDTTIIGLQGHMDFLTTHLRNWQAQARESGKYANSSPYHAQRYNEAVGQINELNEEIAEMTSKLSEITRKEEVAETEKEQQALLETEFAEGWPETESYIKGEAAKRGGLESGGYLTSLAKARALAKTKGALGMSEFLERHLPYKTATVPYQYTPMQPVSGQKGKEWYDYALDVIVPFATTLVSPIAGAALTGTKMVGEDWAKNIFGAKTYGKYKEPTAEEKFWKSIGGY